MQGQEAREGPSVTPGGAEESHDGTAACLDASRPESASPAEPDADEAAPDDEATGELAQAQPSPDPVAPAPKPTIPLRLLLLVTVVNLVLAVGLFVARPPGRIERDTTSPPLPAQVAKLADRVEHGEHGAAYTLTLTDDDLTATARHFLAARTDVPFAQVRVAVVGGQIEVRAVTTGLAVAVPVRVLADVEARDGRPVAKVADVDLGGVALPTFAREQVLAEANRAVDLSQYALPVTVERIELRAGQFEARGTVK